MIDPRLHNETFDDANRRIATQKIIHHVAIMENIARIPRLVIELLSDIRQDKDGGCWPENVLQGFYDPNDPITTPIWALRGKHVKKSAKILEDRIIAIQNTFIDSEQRSKSVSSLLVTFEYASQLVKRLDERIYQYECAHQNPDDVGDNHTKANFLEEVLGAPIEEFLSVAQNIKYHAKELYRQTNILWEANIRIAAPYRKNPDLHAEAIHSLGDSARRYDPRVSPFLQFAKIWMRKHVSDHITFTRMPVKMPTNIYRQILQSYGTETTANYNSYKVGQSSSANDLHDEDESLLDIQSNTNAISSISALEDFVYLVQTQESIEKALTRIMHTKEERSVFMMTIDKCTVTEITQHTGLPPHRIRAIRSEVPKIMNYLHGAIAQ